MAKKMKIEYSFDEEDEGEPSEAIVEQGEAVNEVIAELIEEVEAPSFSLDDLNDYVYHERVGTLDLINYLPRVPFEVLEGKRDFTGEEWAIASSDFDKGFRPIDPSYLIKYQVPENALVFRTQEDMSKNVIKLSTGMVRKWVARIEGSAPCFPAGLIRDNFGFTQYAVAVLRSLMQYTCTRRFTVEWEKIDRDAATSPIKDPSLSEENPDYALCSFYWEKLAIQYRDYQKRMDWISEYKRSRSLKETPPEFIEVEREEYRVHQALSEAKRRIELAKKGFEFYVVKQVDDMIASTEIVVRERAALGNAKLIEAAAETVSDSQELINEDEADLWNQE